MNEFEETQAQIGAVTPSRDALERAMAAARAHQRTRDRAFIAKWIVSLYVASVAASIAYLIYRGVVGNEDSSDGISEIIKVAVVPILTLVMGYYFGTAKSD
jgi:hypothetical protein